MTRVALAVCDGGLSWCVPALPGRADRCQATRPRAWRLGRGLDHLPRLLSDCAALRLSVCALDGAAAALDGLLRSAGGWIRDRSRMVPAKPWFRRRIESSHPRGLRRSRAAPSDFHSLTLGTTSPLMQVWWARLHGSAIPYRLFALSNLASLLALACYPTLVEPHLDAARSAHRLVLRVRGICHGHGNAGVARALSADARSCRDRCRLDDERHALRLRWPKSCSGYCCRWARPCS